MLGHILITAVNAVLPIVLLIVLGYFLRSKGMINDSFIKMGNTLVFKICLPCMLFISVYEIAAMEAVQWDMAIYCVIAIVVLFALGGAVAVVTTKDSRRRGVIWQCCFRSNFAIIGIPLAVSLGAGEADAFGAIIAALAVPIFNMFAVIALSVFTEDASGHRPSIKRIVLDIVKNPLIIGVVLGMLCLGLRAMQRNFFGEAVFTLKQDLKFVYSVMEKLKAMTTPLALVVLGGQFKFSVVKGMFREIAVATVFRIVAAPLLCIGAAVLLAKTTGIISCGADTMPSLIALFGSPVAVSSAVMASQMGGDEQLAAQLVVWTCVGSIFTIFVQVCVLMAAGLLIV